jgi:hypothetical protein
MSSKHSVEELLRLNNYLSAMATHWCPIVSSKKIKKEIIERCNDLGVSLYEVVSRADVSWGTVKSFYMKTEEPESRPSLRAEDIMKIAELIGIEIRVAVLRKPIENIDRDKLLNDKFIPHAQRKKNKKLGRNGSYIPKSKRHNGEGD